MSDRPARMDWLVGIATASLAFLVAASWFLHGRLKGIEERLAATATAPRAPSRGKPPPPDVEAPPPGSLEEVSAKVSKLSSEAYDYYQETARDLHEAKRTLKQLNAAVRRLQQQLAAPGMPSGSWALADPKAAPSPEVLAAYRKQAEAAGVRVSPDLVEVRGVLNLSPWSTMPIEYFVTRWPESGHETLIHVVGGATVDETLSPDQLTGLLTAVYKGMVVAGFTEGESGALERPEPGSDRPRWIPPAGDVVHVGVRYEMGGRIHVARATDWVIDPAAKSVLPEDAFRFTGSGRQEDYQTGDEQLSAEASGILVSVYRNPHTLVEIALPSNLDNDYQYNHVRIPKPARLRLENGQGTLDAVRDRARSALRVIAAVRDGKRVDLTTAPVLVVRDASGNDRTVVFAKAEEGWEATDPALGKGEWRVRVTIDGKEVETAGFEPFYVDILFSKKPIATEGDGAKPLEPIVLPSDIPTGTGQTK